MVGVGAAARQEALRQKVAALATALAARRARRAVGQLVARRLAAARHLRPRARAVAVHEHEGRRAAAVAEPLPPGALGGERRGGARFGAARYDGGVGLAAARRDVGGARGGILVVVGLGIW